MTDPGTMASIAIIFLLAGMVKGVVGMGLPAVSLGLLTATFDLTIAMALMIIPSFATNLLQATHGGHGLMLIGRLWPFLTIAAITVWVGTQVLTTIDLTLLSGLLGLLLVVYAVQGLLGPGISIPRRWQIWTGPVFGATNGILTGMTGSFVVPGVLYLQAIGLCREALIQAMGILFTVSTIALALCLQGRNLLNAELGLTSGAALIPAFLGMAIGQAVRRQLSESSFRRIFFHAILILGIYILFMMATDLR